MMLRSGRAFDSAIDDYFGQCVRLENLRSRIAPSDLLVVRYEDMVCCPQDQLARICRYLELWPNPHISPRVLRSSTTQLPDRQGVDVTDQGADQVASDPGDQVENEIGMRLLHESPPAFAATEPAAQPHQHRRTAPIDQIGSPHPASVVHQPGPGSAMRIAHHRPDVLQHHLQAFRFINRRLEHPESSQVQANWHSIRTHRSPSSARRSLHHRVSRASITLPAFQSSAGSIPSPRCRAVSRRCGTARVSTGVGASADSGGIWIHEGATMQVGTLQSRLLHASFRTAHEVGAEAVSGGRSRPVITDPGLAHALLADLADLLAPGIRPLRAWPKMLRDSRLDAQEPSRCSGSRLVSAM